MRDFLTFRTLITPTVIRILFFLGVLVIAIWGLALFLVPGQDASVQLVGLVVFVLGPLVARILLEFIIIIFRIHETMNDLREDFADLGRRLDGTRNQPGDV